MPTPIIAFAKDWHEDPTSNHHVLRELAKTRRVLWLNSLATRTPKLSSGRDLGKIRRKLAEFANALGYRVKQFQSRFDMQKLLDADPCCSRRCVFADRLSGSRRVDSGCEPDDLFRFRSHVDSEIGRAHV